MTNCGFKSGEIERIRSRLKELIGLIGQKLYIVKQDELIFEILDYPFRLVSASEIVSKNGKDIKQGYIDKLTKPEYIILDSGIFNAEITNRTILRISNKLKPTYIVPKDYINDNEKTVESIKDFLNIMDSYDNGFELLLPLQKPWTIDKSLMEHDYFAIGGIVGLAMGQRKTVVRSVVRKYPDKKFHLFGVNPMSMPEIFNEHKNIISSDVAVRKNTIFKEYVYKGEYSRLNTSFHTIYYVLNDLVGYYNFLLKSKELHQESMF